MREWMNRGPSKYGDCFPSDSAFCFSYGNSNANGVTILMCAPEISSCRARRDYILANPDKIAVKSECADPDTITQTTVPSAASAGLSDPANTGWWCATSSNGHSICERAHRTCLSMREWMNRGPGPRPGKYGDCFPSYRAFCFSYGSASGVGMLTCASELSSCRAWRDQRLANPDEGAVKSECADPDTITQIAAPSAAPTGPSDPTNTAWWCAASKYFNVCRRERNECLSMRERMTATGRNLGECLPSATAFCFAKGSARDRVVKVKGPAMLACATTLVGCREWRHVALSYGDARSECSEQH